MKYIGLDLSITGTGYSVITDKGVRIASGSLKTKPGELDVIRFARIAESLFEATRPEPDDLILIEDYAFSAKGQITRLAELCGVIKDRIYFQKGCSFLIAAPQHLKMFCTGKGNAKKELMMKEAFKKWGLDSLDNNEVDAFVLSKLLYAACDASGAYRTPTEDKAIKGVEKRNEGIIKKEINSKGCLSLKRDRERESGDKKTSANKRKELLKRK